MANIINDRDLLLTAASIRLTSVATNFIAVTSSATGFVVNGAASTPATITLTFEMKGSLVGYPTITQSGVSSVITTNLSPTVTTVTIAAVNMTADFCNVTATLVYLGTSYTVTATVEGSVTVPNNVGTVTTSVEGVNVKLSWPRNTEVDVVGYEVRDTDSNWGTDSFYLYNGSATSCVVPPGILNTIKNYYVKAYDASKLYSTAATIGSYTVNVPTAPTGLTAVYSSTSNTQSTATLSWNNVNPPFGFYQYRVRLTLPNLTFTDTIVNTPNLVIAASWIGTATAVVYVTDNLNNESLASSVYNLVKLAPENIDTPLTVSVVGTKLLLDWNEPTKTTLPITGYEVRSANTNWGDGSTYLWKGLASECQTNPGALAVPTNYFVKAIDSDNVYSTSATATTYTRTVPPSVTSVTHIYSVTTTGLSTITFNWDKPSGETFAIQLYRVTLTKPGPIVVTADLYSNSWTVPSDWVGSATFDIQTVDILNTVSNIFSQPVVKIDPNITTGTFTATPTNNTLNLSWTYPPNRPGLAWIRSANTATVTDIGHGYISGTIITVSVSSDITAVPLGNYVINFINANSYSFTCLNAGATSGTLTNNTQSSLLVTNYEVRASNNTSVIYRGPALNCVLQGNNLVLGANTWYLYAIDSAGKYSGAKALTYTYTILTAPTASVSPTFTVNGTAIFKWTTPTGSFQVSHYNVSLTATGMTTKTVSFASTEWELPVDWNNTTATLTITPVDVLGNNGTAGTQTLIKANPNPVSSVVYPFSSTGTGQIASISWTAPAVTLTTQVPIAYYSITITKPSLATVVTSVATNAYITSADWEGSASIAITAVDVAGHSSSLVNTTLTKVAPASPTLPVIVTKGAGINISWTPSVAGSLPVDGYQLSVSSTLPQSNPFLYKGNSSNIDVASVSANNTWYLFAYDTAGKYCSTPLTITKAYTGPSVPQNITAQFTFGTALFKWTEPATSEFIIDRYELTLTAVGMPTVTATLYSTDWEIPVGWSNTTATLTIVPYDLAGFFYSGAGNTVTLQNTLLSAPSTPTLTTIGTNLDIDWADNTQSATNLGVVHYEIKDAGINASLYRGSGSKTQISLIGKPSGTTINYNLYAYDYNDVVSPARSFSYTPIAPVNIELSTFIGTFGNSLTDASLILNWVGVVPVFGLDYYEVTYDAITIKVSSTSLTISPLPTNWLGVKNFTVKTVDLLGNKSSGTVLAVTKLIPNVIGSYSANVIDNNVMLYWALPLRSSLPVSAVRVKRGPLSGSTWLDSTLIGDKSGTFTTVFERVGGTFTYWLAAIDTDNQEGTPISFPVTVSQPPDFIFNGEQVSTFTGTYSNALLVNSSIVMPIDTTETFASHFTDIRILTMTVVAGGTGYVVGDTIRLNSGTVVGTDHAVAIVTSVNTGAVTGLTVQQGGSYTVSPTVTAGPTTATFGVGTGLTVTITAGGNWAGPSTQITAGYPVYLQPALASGYYEEVFDFGTTLSSSQVTVTANTVTIDGLPLITTTMSTSLDNITYSGVYSSSSIFASNFRYVKVRITGSQNDIGKGLTSLNYLSVRLDSKLINWAGTTNCFSSDIDGTLTNFGKEFIDVSSVSVSPAGSVFAVPTYDFKDTILTGTYVVTSNSCVVTTAVAHGFSANALGQEVRLSFNSGTAPNGIYAVTAVGSTTQFTVSIITANTSGNLTAYSQGMRLYLFNSSGTRISGTVSWSIKGN